MNYINGLSASAREIMEYFNFDDQIDRMDDPMADILFRVVKSFQEIDLTPDRTKMDQDSMEMGCIFEDLIRRFSEQSNETAGEHFTPREVIRLMVNVLIPQTIDEYFEREVKPHLPEACYDPSKNLASIVRGFKSGVTKRARLVIPGFAWQSRYHDHIIRDSREFAVIENYIRHNPRNHRCHPGTGPPHHPFSKTGQIETTWIIDE